MILPSTNRAFRSLPDSYRKLASLFGAATAALGIFGVLGWILGMPGLASIRSSYVPMAPLTAIAFLSLGGVLLVHSMAPSQGPVGILVAVSSAIISAYGLIELVEYMGIPVLSLEEWLFPNPPMIGAISTGRMSPATAALLLLSGSVVPMLFLRERGGERKKLFGDLAGCLGTLVAMVGTVIVLSYLHGAPFLYGTSTIPMAATTALAFLLLGTGQVLAVGPDGFPSRVFAGPSARARLLRAFVSTMVGVVVAIDLMHVYARWIFFDSNAFMAGVSTTAFAVIAGALIARVALKVGDDMDRSEEIRKQAEEALRMSEERHRITLMSVGDGVIATDDQGKVELMNPVTETLTGWSQDEARGRPLEEVFRIVNEKTRKDVENPVRRVMREGLVVGLANHTLLIARDGTERPIADSGAPIRNERNEINGVVLVFRDQTEERAAERALHESEERYRSLFQNMREGIAYCKMIFENGEARDFVYLSVNGSFETLTGLKGVAGKRVSEVIPGIRETDPGLFHIYGRVALTGAPEKFETFVEALHQWFSISVYCPERGYFVAVFDVITERKRAEEEREKLEAQFRQAQKMEAVGRLAGGVAHDFNNLLTVITGYSELLLQKIEKESPLHGEVEEIKRAGERAASLTQQLLAFSRKQIIEPKVVHLDHLIAEMHKMLTRLIGEEIDLQVATGKSLGSVKVDPGQFHQILMNLVVNARDAMPDGGKIVIETANVDLDDGYCAVHPYVKPGWFVMMSVSDTGNGMREEVKAHIFEPFFTTKEKGSGTGLGLAMIYGAVHQAGGSIQVYSEVGFGTTFKIYLPRIEEEAVKPEKDDRSTDLPGGTETVLLVEDEDSVRDLCVQILERLGYKVLRGSNGTEAIAVAQKYGEQIDLLLTDVVMPGMSGAELATQLVLHHPEMKVLFTSGYTDDAITRHGILDEGVSFIGKPYTPLALARKVREVLDKA